MTQLLFQSIGEILLADQWEVLRKMTSWLSFVFSEDYEDLPKKTTYTLQEKRISTNRYLRKWNFTTDIN